MGRGASLTIFVTDCSHCAGVQFSQFLWLIVAILTPLVFSFYTRYSSLNSGHKENNHAADPWPLATYISPPKEVCKMNKNC